MQAGTGAKALSLAAETQFDAVVLDVGLPDMDGYSVSTRMAEMCRTPVPVVFLSGTATAPEDRVRGYDSGSACYLIKPARPEEVVAAVRAVVRAGDAGRGSSRAALRVAY